MKTTIAAKTICLIALFVGLGFGQRQPSAQPSIIYVHPGDSLSQIVSNAPAGSTIIVQAGVYKDSLTVTQPGIRLIGAGASENGTVLSNEGVGADAGINVKPGADNFQLTGVLINGFKNDGVMLNGVRDYRITHNVAQNNGEYGIFPVFCTGGVISDNLAIGHADTGIYVGQSSGATVSHNIVHDNINGIEIENSSDCIVTENEAVDNTLGILVVELPLLQITATNRITVTKNYVHNNNNPGDFRVNEQFIQAVPAGSGLLVVGADNVTVTDNVLLENNSFGIGVVRLPVAFDILDPGIAHIADNSRTIANLCLHNGRQPDRDRIRRVIPNFPTGANLYWDQTGTGHCFDRNVVTDDAGGTSVPAPTALPPCPPAR
jgi:parallel beta-helix repeat protein